MSGYQNVMLEYWNPKFIDKVKGFTAFSSYIHYNNNNILKKKGSLTMIISFIQCLLT